MPEDEKGEPNYDWELYRENIRPLPEGRRIGALTEALRAPRVTNAAERVKAKYDEIEAQAETSEDPLSLQIDFIRWFDESFPFGRQKLFYEYLWKIVTKYAQDERYLNDQRMLRVWDKMGENSLGNGWKVFQHANRIGSLLKHVPFYIKWARCFEATHNITEARKVFQRARINGAMPIDQLNYEEDMLEMREMRRVQEQAANDSWEEDSDEGEEMPDINTGRVALTHLQTISDDGAVPVIRHPLISGVDRATQQQNSKCKPQVVPSSSNAKFEVYCDTVDSFETEILQSIYDMDTHIERIHLPDPNEIRQIVTSDKKGLCVRREPPPGSFTVYQDTPEEEKKPKSKLCLQKAMRKDSIEEVLYRRYLEANNLPVEM